MVRLTRRYRFSASHRLHTGALTEADNHRLYGKCANPYGHGHNYALEISVEGEPGADGQVVNRSELDQVVEGRVVRLLDHKSLNHDVPQFAATVPTTENLARWIETQLLEGWSLRARLASIRIVETARNSFELEVGKGGSGREE